MPYWEYLEENWCTQNWHIIFPSVFLRSQKNKSNAQHQDTIKIYNGCSLNACCRQGNWILFTEYFYPSKAITWEILVAFMVSDFSHVGLLLSSTTVLQIHDPCQRKEQYLSATLKGELTKLKAYTYPADQKVFFQIWGQDTQPAPNNLRHRLAKTIDQFIQILDLFPQKPLH